MSRFIIFGYSGQDGSLAAEWCRANGHEVIGVSHSQSSISMREGHDVRLWDFKSDSKLKEILRSTAPDYLINFAAVHHSSQERGHQVEADSAVQNQILQVNFNSLASIIRAVLSVNPEIGLVHSSSSQIFTPFSSGTVVSEISVRQPSTFYGVTKAAGMSMVEYFRSFQSLRAASLVFFNHESELRSPRFLSRQITMAAAEIKLGRRKVLAIQNIGAKADFSSARDSVRATIEVCLQEKFDDYIISSGKATSVQTLIDVAFKELDLNWQDFVSFETDEAIPYLVGDNQKILSEVSLPQATAIEDTMRQMTRSELARLS